MFEFSSAGARGVRAGGALAEDADFARGPLGNDGVAAAARRFQFPAPLLEPLAVETAVPGQLLFDHKARRDLGYELLFTQAIVCLLRESV